MHQIKIIKENDEKIAEQEVNKFCKENRKYDIISIKMQTQANMGHYLITVMIDYFINTYI